MNISPRIRFKILIGVWMIGLPRIQTFLFSQGSLPQQLPVYDVASLHETDLSSHDMSSDGVATYWRPRACKYQPDRVECALTVRGFIREAWGIPFSEDYKLDENILPRDGVGRKAFELKATMPVGTSQASARLMMQQLLRERFGLKIHREKRDMKVYALVIGKSGNHLKLAEDLSALNKAQPEFTFGVLGDTGYLKGSCVDLNMLASSIGLNSYYDVPLVNATGLSGKYQMDIRWASEDSSSRILGDPNFFHVLQKETGLTLEKRVMPVDVLVVDSVSQVPLDYN